MPETLLDLLRRDRQRSEPGSVVRPDLAQVRALVRRIRRRRRVATAGAAALAVVVVALGVPALRGGRAVQETPAVTQGSIVRLTRSGDGLLTMPDLLRRDEPTPPARWRIEPSRSPAGTGQDQVTLPTCTQSQVQTVQVPPGGARSRRWNGTTEQGEVTVSETVVHLDARSAADVDARLGQARRCEGDSLLNQVRLADGGGVLVTGTASFSVAPSQPPVISGPVSGGRGYARSGDTLVIVNAMSTRGSTAEGLPGQTDWLVDLTVRALGRATGQPVTVPGPIPTARQAALMAASPHNQAPPGMLTLADLGSDKRWVLPLAGPESKVDVAVLASVPACGSTAFTPAGGRGTEQTYRSMTSLPNDPSSFYHSMVEERRITLSAAQARAVKAALTALASCHRPTDVEQVLRTGNDPLRVVTGQHLHGEDAAPPGQWYTVTGMALTGNTFVWLQSTVSRGSGTMPPQPGHVDWVADLMPVAARRAAP